MALPKEKQDEVITNLFSVKNGAVFSFSIIAIRASDFGINAYSYADQAYRR